MKDKYFRYAIRVAAILGLVSIGFGLPAEAVAQSTTYPALTLPSTGTSAVATFESIGLYWTPGSNPGTAGCTVQYRKSSDTTWLNGLAMWYDARNSECRGSLVQLSPGTSYDVQFTLPGQAPSRQLRVQTWSESFPIAQTITLPPGTSNQTLNITQGGTASGYVLYTTDPTTPSVIDVANAQSYDVNISAPYVIVRGLTLKGATIHGINLSATTHDVVIENNDISGWGRPSGATTEGYAQGAEQDSGVYALCEINSSGIVKDGGGYGPVANALTRVVIQRNRIHDPRYGSNSWSSGHPYGPQGISLVECAGNHVIRYNEIYSSETTTNAHYFDDGIGGSENFSEYGAPGRDSDIYGNRVEDAMDDCIEADGGGENVRIWGNYCNQTNTMISTTALVIGPEYLFRNVYNRSRELYQSSLDADDREGFAKSGSISSCSDGPSFNGTCQQGRRYIFHNTTLQATASGAVYGLGIAYGISGTNSTSQLVSNTVSRNNIYQTWKNNATSPFQEIGSGNDFDYDMTNSSSLGETHGLASAIPIYATGNGWTSGSGGLYQLATNSPGYDKGVPIPNFNDNFLGAAPDIGAAEAGAPAMVFGVNGGNLTPTPTPTPTPTSTAPAPTPTPTLTVSAAGTAIPPATQIVDASQNVWTVSGGVIYKNGTTAGTSANVIELYWNGSTIYQENSALNWWYWTGTGWTATANPIPATTTALTTSVAGTSIPPATQIIDASKNVWTVSGGVVYINGAAAGYSANVTQLYWNGSTLYQVNTAGAWYSWTGTTWVAATNPVPTTTTTSTATISTTGVNWSCDFENSYCNLIEQSELGDAPTSARRSTEVATGRSGKLVVRLHTESGDNNVHGSGTWERDDLTDMPTKAYCNQGQEEWWAHSVLFPSDFYFPQVGQQGGVVFAFHHTSSSGLTNLELQYIAGVGLRLRGHGGSKINGGEFTIPITDPYGAPAGSITKNVWYDFVYHIKWNSSSSGLVEAWLNGKKIGTYKGATLYTGYSCYLKVQNYHGPYGVATSVVHDRVVRGTSATSVAITPLSP